MRPSASQLSPDTRGTVRLESLVASLPLLLAFFALWELGELLAVRAVVQRASEAAGREAAVALPGDPASYDGEPRFSFAGARRADIELAAGLVLASVPGLTAHFDVAVGRLPPHASSVAVTVRARHACSAISLLCGADSALELSASREHAFAPPVAFAGRAELAAPALTSTAPLAASTDEEARARAQCAASLASGHPTDGLSRRQQKRFGPCRPRCADRELAVLAHAGSELSRLRQQSDWSFESERRWLEQRIAARTSFFVASALDASHLGSQYGCSAYAREVQQLLNAGYVRMGHYLAHPAEVERGCFAGFARRPTPDTLCPDKLRPWGP
jgi:hypothetical protein